MSKVRIKIVTIGHMPLGFTPSKIKKWKSSIFEVIENIDNYALRCDSDGIDWEFSDQLVKEQLPNKYNADYMIAIVNVPIECNWYSRRLGNNQVVFTFSQVKEILEYQNIPLENVIYRLLYAYTLVYLRANNKIPGYDANFNFTHDETRGCIFDMNGIKSDLIASCHKPQICEECQERLRQERVSRSDIENTQKEIKKIQKDLYYRILTHIKNHPILALIISSMFALSIGTFGSILASYIYSYLTKAQ